MKGIRTLTRLSLIMALAMAASVALLPSSASAISRSPAPPACSTLAAKLLGGDIKYANSQIVAAEGTPAAQAANFTGATPSETTIPVGYCLVVLSYSSEKTAIQAQNITIYVGLPLNSTDGGTTGSTVDPPWNFTTVQGNWNGRTEAIGGGVCTGNTNVTSAVVAGFVGSGTDGGHGGNNANSPLDEEPYTSVPLDDPSNTCQPGIVRINGKNEVNAQFIEDFYTNGPVQEVIWSKQVAALYYGRAPLYNYWNGCSTGGHQGYAVAESAPGELQGILASSPGIYEERFTTAQMWGQIAMYDVADEVVAGGKLAAVQNAAIAACDGNDGVLDGIIDDPRTCTFNANANVCGATNAPAAPNCLTQTEADAVNLMWDGPRNEAGNRIWFPIDRGTDFSIWDGNVPFQAGYVHLGYALVNPAYYNAGSYPGSYPGYWGNIAMNAAIQGSIPGAVTNYAAVAQAGSQTIADLTDNVDDLDGFKAAGGKMVSFVGGNDQLIMPRGVINYYRGMAQRYKLARDQTGFDGIQSFYRLFHVPGTGHCGLGILSHGSLGPWPQNGADFDAVINWVENGIPPSEVIGAGNTAASAYNSASATTLTRPVCPYPQTAVYVGSGNVDQAQNWVCGGNLEKNVPIQVGSDPPAPIPGAMPVPCYDVLVKYKDEIDGPLDYAGSGVNQASCK